MLLVLVLRHKVLEYYQVHSSLVCLWGSPHTLLQMSMATNGGSQMKHLGGQRVPLLGAWGRASSYMCPTPLPLATSLNLAIRLEPVSRHHPQAVTRDGPSPLPPPPYYATAHTHTHTVKVCKDKHSQYTMYVYFLISTSYLLLPSVIE